MKANTTPQQFGYGAPPAIIVHAMKENKKPIGFAAWSTEDDKPKRAPRKRKSKEAN